MLYIRWLLQISTFSRITLTVVLALGAAFLSPGSKSVQAEVMTIAKAPKAAPAGEMLHSSFYRNAQAVVGGLDSTFDPEPNAPPERTGGSGTR